jgi:hypothetical protein
VEAPGVLVGVGVFVPVGVGVRLPVGVNVLDGEGVFVLLGVAVRLPVGVNVLDGMGVFVLVGVNVLEGVNVLLGSGVSVFVNVLEGSGVLLGVGVGVLVGIQAEVRISKAKTSIFFMGSFSFNSTIRIRLHATVRQTGGARSFYHHIVDAICFLPPEEWLTLWARMNFSACRIPVGQGMTARRAG